jgi:hypothetical protein
LSSFVDDNDAQKAQDLFVHEAFEQVRLNMNDQRSIKIHDFPGIKLEAICVDHSKRSRKLRRVSHHGL